MGGRIKNAMPMNTRRGPNNERFALLAFTEPWLGFATVGSSRPGRSAFGPRNFLDQLAVHLERACNGETPVLATETEEGDENYDPMEEVEADGKDSSSSTVTRGSGEKRTRYYKNHAKNKLLDLNLPSQPPEVAKDNRFLRSVQMLCVNRKQIWLRLSDVPWAVKYLYIQALLKGVPLVAPDSAGPSGPASSEEPATASV